jgi:hypothetical protein
MTFPKQKKLTAFHNNPSIKIKCLARLKKHRENGDFIVDTWWDGDRGKGCAVGCTIHSGKPGLYEDELGIPAALAWLEGVIHPRLPEDRLDRWAEEFLGAIKPGADLSLTSAHFIYWLLTDPAGPRRYCSDRERALLDKVVGLYVRRINEDEPTRFHLAIITLDVEGYVEYGKEGRFPIQLAMMALSALSDAFSIWDTVKYARRTMPKVQEQAFSERMAEKLVEILRSAEKARVSNVLQFSRVGAVERVGYGVNEVSRIARMVEVS